MQRSFSLRPLSILLISFIISSCALPIGKSPFTPGYVERGVASWYGEQFHGRPTSSGEIYNMYGRTAAHKLMPLGTIAKVTNLENGRCVIVKINDRGPFIRGRIIDLSYSAAAKLDIVETGLARVEIEVLKWGAGISGFTVQAGSFVMAENALRLKKRLKQRYSNVYIVKYKTNRKTFYRVRVRSTMNRREATVLAQELSASGFSSFITRRD